MASPPEVRPQTIVEQNCILLKSLFRFRASSRLLDYVNLKSGNDKEYYTLVEILMILKETIRREQLYDEKNPAVILCSAELEDVLNMKALHVTEIRDLILNHLIRVRDRTILARHGIHDLGTESISTQRVIHTASISTQVCVDRHKEFKVNQKFLDVFSAHPNFDKNRTIYTYEEVTSLLSAYIIQNKKKFFDPRNMKLAIVRDDPLGEAFGVNAFHRCQVNHFLHQQLTPIRNVLSVVQQNWGK